MKLKMSLLAMTAMLAMAAAALTPKDLPTYDFEEMFGHDFDNPFFRGDHSNKKDNKNNVKKENNKWDDFSQLGSELDAKFAKEDAAINKRMVAESAKDLKATKNQDFSTKKPDIFESELFGEDFEKRFTTIKENLEYTTKNPRNSVEPKSNGKNAKIKETKRDDFFQRELFGADFDDHFTTERENFDKAFTTEKTNKDNGLRVDHDKHMKEEEEDFFQRDLFGADFESHFTTTEENLEPTLTSKTPIKTDKPITEDDFEISKDEFFQRDLFGADFDDHYHDFELTTQETTSTTRRRRMPWLRQLVRMLADRALSNKESRLEEGRRMLRPIVTEKPAFKDDSSSNGGSFWPILSLLSGNLFQRNGQKNTDFNERVNVENPNHVSRVDPNQASINSATHFIFPLFPFVLYNLVL